MASERDLLRSKKTALVDPTPTRARRPFDASVDPTPKRARRPFDASVDHTEARNDILECFGRSDRRALLEVDPKCWTTRPGGIC
jgi:hypothetical protein